MEKVIYWFPFIKTTQQLIWYHGCGSKISWNRTFGEPTIRFTPIRIAIFLQQWNSDLSASCTYCVFRIYHQTDQVTSLPSLDLRELLHHSRCGLSDPSDFNVQQWNVVTVSSHHPARLRSSQPRLPVWQSWSLELTSHLNLYRSTQQATVKFCLMKIITSGEILYRLDNNKHLVYFQQGQTIPIHCPAKKLGQKELFLPQEVLEFKLEAGCKTKLVNHFIFSTKWKKRIKEHLD